MNSRILMILLSLACTGSAQTVKYRIETIAGADNVRDGRPARAAILQFASGIAFDSTGRLYIADSTAGRIRGVKPDRLSTGTQSYRLGEIQTVAGMGATGFSGDDGPATQAYLAGPRDLVCSAAGDVYVVDSSVSRVRKIGLDGIIHTVAGGGTTTDGENVPATSILFQGVGGIALDTAGNLYLAEQRGLVRRISPQGQITTIAGGGDLGLEADGGPARLARLLNPAGLAVDNRNNIYVSEQIRHTVRKITPEGIISTVAGTGRQGSTGDGGPAREALLGYPTKLLADDTGTVFVVDNNSSVRAIAPSGEMQSVYRGYSSVNGLTKASDGALWIAESSRVGVVFSPSSADWAIGTQGENTEGYSPLESLLYLSSLARDREGILYLSEGRYSRIRAIGHTGVITTFAQSTFAENIGDGGPVSQARLGYPSAILAAANGDLWIADTGLARVRRVTRSDGIIRTIAGTGQSAVTGDGGLAIEARIFSPSYIALGPDGSLYMTNGPYLIRKVDRDGIISTIAGTGQAGFSGDGGPATAARIYTMGIAADDGGGLVVADYGNRRIRYVNSEGIISTIAGGGTLTGDGPATEVDMSPPRDVVFGPTGDLFFATQSGIFRIDRSGWLERIAGTLQAGYAGDGGPALDAKLNTPGSFVFDAAGAIYFSDGIGSRIRKLTPIE